MRYLPNSILKRAGLIALVLASLIGVSAVVRLYNYLSEMSAICARAASRGLTSSEFPFVACPHEDPLVGAIQGGLIAATVYGLGIFVVLVMVGYVWRAVRGRRDGGATTAVSDDAKPVRYADTLSLHRPK